MDMPQFLCNTSIKNFPLDWKGGHQDCSFSKNPQKLQIYVLMDPALFRNPAGFRTVYILKGWLRFIKNYQLINFEILNNRISYPFSY